MEYLDDYLEALEEAARNATPGPWVAGWNRETSWVRTDDSAMQIAETGHVPNASYIALVSPGLILNLIHHYRISEGQNNALMDRFIDRVTARSCSKSPATEDNNEK